MSERHLLPDLLAYLRIQAHRSRVQAETLRARARRYADSRPGLWRSHLSRAGRLSDEGERYAAWADRLESLLVAGRAT